ncbi:MAG: hypothetical protein K6A69_01670 [Lachnospiraceae bacterium]|nr:hypothetical protein [Lachnospiraceae bacterium]
MEEGVIRCRLDLLLRLVDTTTGMATEENDARFYLDGKLVEVHYKGGGNYILMNSGRENGLMQIEVYGFEPYSIKVDYEALDPILPAIDVFLIPSENTPKGESLITLEGRLSGLSAVETIHPGRPVTSIREFDAKKCTMTVFQPNRRVNMTDTYYGLLNVEKNTFEDLIVGDEVADKKVKLRKPIEEEFSPNAPIFRILYGRVNEDGTYLLRVRDDGKNLNYLVKYIVNGEARYKQIDFHQLDGVVLD